MSGIDAVINSGLIIYEVALFAIMSVVVGIPVFWLTLPFFSAPTVFALLGWWTGLPLLLPLALGLSLLESVAIGSTVDALSKLLTIPGGALLGAITGSIIGGTLGTLTDSLVRAIVYSIAGTGIGAGIGATIGATVAIIIALITHLRLTFGNESGASWLDLRLINNAGFGDPMSWIPTLDPGAYQTSQVDYRASVPAAAVPVLETTGLRDDIELREGVDALVG